MNLGEIAEWSLWAVFVWAATAYFARGVRIMRHRRVDLIAMPRIPSRRLNPDGKISVRQTEGREAFFVGLRNVIGAGIVLVSLFLYIPARAGMEEGTAIVVPAIGMVAAVLTTTVMSLVFSFTSSPGD